MYTCINNCMCLLNCFCMLSVTALCPRLERMIDKPTQHFLENSDFIVHVSLRGTVNKWFRSQPGLWPFVFPQKAFKMVCHDKYVNLSLNIYDFISIQNQEHSVPGVPCKTLTIVKMLADMWHKASVFFLLGHYNRRTLTLGSKVIIIQWCGCAFVQSWDSNNWSPISKMCSSLLEDCCCSTGGHLFHSLYSEKGDDSFVSKYPGADIQQWYISVVYTMKPDLTLWNFRITLLEGKGEEATIITQPKVN